MVCIKQSFLTVPMIKIIVSPKPVSRKGNESFINVYLTPSNV